MGDIERTLENFGALGVKFVEWPAAYFTAAVVLAALVAIPLIFRAFPMLVSGIAAFGIGAWGVVFGFDGRNDYDYWLHWREYVGLGVLFIVAGLVLIVVGSRRDRAYQQRRADERAAAAAEQAAKPHPMD